MTYHDIFYSLIFSTQLSSVKELLFSELGRLNLVMTLDECLNFENETLGVKFSELLALQNKLFLANLGDPRLQII